MANLNDVASWDEVYQFAITDPVQGGPGGIDNQPHQSLENRTNWLRQRLAALVTQSGLVDSSVDNTQLAQMVPVHVATVAALRAAPQPVTPNGTTPLMMTRGQVSDGDQLGSTFIWSPSFIGVDDGINTIQPATVIGNAPGRWRRAGVNAGALGGQSVSYFASAAAVAAQIALLAPLDSANLTGTPTAPTPVFADSSNKIATTSFVHGGFLALGDAANLYLTIVNAANRYLSLSGGTVIGAVALNAGGTSLTPATTDNDTSIATTNFVHNVLVAYALLNSPGFSGAPTTPTAADGTTSTQIANCTFVARAIAGAIALTSGNFSAQSLVAGSLIIKGGQVVVTTNPQSFTFASLTGSAFPTGCLGIVTTPYGQVYPTDVLSYNAAGFTVGVGATGVTLNWIAIGH